MNIYLGYSIHTFSFETGKTSVKHVTEPVDLTEVNEENPIGFLIDYSDDCIHISYGHAYGKYSFHRPQSLRDIVKTILDNVPPEYINVDKTDGARTWSGTIEDLLDGL